MKLFKLWISMLTIFTLCFSFAGTGLAAEQTNPEVKEDERVEVTFDFKDSKEAEWAFESIAKMQSKEVFKGYEDGTFRPNQPVKRVEAIVTAVRMMGLEEEAKAKPANTLLHFKDAKLIEQKFAWAKGYIAVALENGLFDASESIVQPEKAASRVWIASLLVRALGLQSLALQQMTMAPEFTDAKKIPAGAIGYVNVAAERNLVTGYPDGTFKPDRNVTRAEMAALLERTNDGLLEESGAVTVLGKIEAIGFGDGSVTDSIYSTQQGSITIHTFNGSEATYSIPSELLVKYFKRFIPANQLLAGDAVSLVVKDDVVVEAALLQEESLKESTSGIRELKLKIESVEEQEFSLYYRNKEGKVTAEIKKEADDSEEKLRGQEAIEVSEAFLSELSLTPDMDKSEIFAAILDSLQISKDEINEFKLEIKYANGKKIAVEFENDRDDEEENGRDDEEDDRSELGGISGVTQFKLPVILQLEFHY